MSAARLASASPARDRAARLRRSQRNTDLVLLLGALAIVVASAILTPTDSVVMLFGWEVPPLCTWKRITGMDCPGCGLTRSFTYMGHGELLSAYGRHRLGPLLYAGVALQVPWRLFKLVRGLRADRVAEAVAAHTEPLGGAAARD